MTASEILIAEAVHFGGRWSDIVSAINRRELLADEEVIRINRSLKCKAITILDEGYPQYLKELYQPPLVLFYYGDISLINNPQRNIGIVGTRHPSTNGMIITEEIASEISKEYVIVSGLASGVDRTAHKAAIKSGGKTVAVLGCGIDICWPYENLDIYEEIKNGNKHLIVSEYPGRVSPNSVNFPVRNRLIAQFSKGILVTEAKIKSGTSITVGFGLLYGRDIMCVPSIDYNESGCNKFIKEGAFLVENYDDVAFVMKSNLI